MLIPPPTIEFHKNVGSYRRSFDSIGSIEEEKWSFVRKNSWILEGSISLYYRNMDPSINAPLKERKYSDADVTAEN